MTSFDPFASIVELGQQLRSGQLTSASLTQGYLDRIKQYDEKFNAFVEVLESHALEQAKFADVEFEQELTAGRYTAFLMRSKICMTLLVFRLERVLIC